MLLVMSERLARFDRLLCLCGAQASSQQAHAAEEEDEITVRADAGRQHRQGAQRGLHKQVMLPRRLSHCRYWL